MKYRGDISSEEYAAMEDGYEQGITDGRAERDQVIAVLAAALERRVGGAALPIGTRVRVRSLRTTGVVIGPDGVGDEALAVALDPPYPRGFEGRLCCASVDECTVIR